MSDVTLPKQIESISDAGFDAYMNRMEVQNPAFNPASMAGSDVTLMKASQNARQAFDGWTTFDASWFTYASPTSINVQIPNSSPDSALTAGDKVWVSQGGSDKYFWVTWVSSTQIGIAGGDNNTFTNAKIDGIFFSKVSNPSGFPSASQMYYDDMQVILGISTGATVPGTVTTYFTMSGGVITLNMRSKTALTTSGGAIGIYIVVQIPTALVTPTGVAATQIMVAYPTFGYTDNTVDTVIGHTIIFYSATNAVTGYSWPQYLTGRYVDFGTYQFGNSGGAASMNINGSTQYTINL